MSQAQVIETSHTDLAPQCHYHELLTPAPPDLGCPDLGGNGPRRNEDRKLMPPASNRDGKRTLFLMKQLLLTCRWTL